MNFGVNLKITRQAKGLSQSAVMMKTGIPTHRISQYENGHVEPSLGVARKFAEALGVSLDFLAGLTASAPPAA